MTDRTAAPAVETGRIVVDGRPIAFEPGDSLAVAILRAGEVPGRGGTLCLAGDCGNCLAQVDGIAYLRTCQVAARPGLAVVRHPAVEMPPLPVVHASDLTAPPAELKQLVPPVDLTGGGRYPVLGASHHVEGATARHDRVAWAYAAGASQRGVHVVQHTPVTGLLRDGERSSAWRRRTGRSPRGSCCPRSVGGSPGWRRTPASACRSAPTRCTRS